MRMGDDMFISLWVHGTAGNVDEPCGEVDVFEISGEKIHSTILERLINYESNPERMEWFGNLPTEKALLVDAKDVSDEDVIKLEVIGYFEDPIADSEQEGL